ncbi:MAG TPA: hypothetical protein VJ843_00585 [Candidatus Saccharimonadales bacterium]|nr:hypothetical protein [Candidatus Saccharimonadales bacterium]
MRFLSLALAFFSFWGSNIQNQSISTQQGQLTPDDYAVYSAAINHLYVKDRIKLIVILDQTKEKQPLDAQFDLKVRYVFEKKDNLDPLLYNPDNKAFSEKYPDSPGYIRLSEICFNSQLNKAGVMIERYCGLLCAEGIYVKLEKKGGVWVVVGKEISWQS